MNRLLAAFILILSLQVQIAHASTTLGTIDPNNTGHYKALIENSGLGAANTINFGAFTIQASKNITVSSSELRGYAWGDGVGWIVVNCLDTSSGCSSTNSNFKVANDGSGNLSGYAWGENTGWINFGPFSNATTSRVKISNGLFGGTIASAGYAWAQNFGWIKFDCSSAASCVETDWRPVTPPGGGGGGPTGGTAMACNDHLDNDGDGLIDYPSDTGCSGPLDNDETNTIIPPDTCATNPSLCVPPPDICVTNPSLCTPPPTPTCATNPALCPPPVDCTTNPSLCVPPPDTCATNPSLCTPPPTFCQQNPTDPSCTTPPPPPPTTGCSTDPAGCVPTTPTTPTGGTIKTLSASFGGRLASFVGLAAVPIASAATYFMLNPFSFVDIGLWIARLWSLFLVFLGIKKKSNPWGTVYDSVTKQPIDPAYVVLYDMEGKEIATSITDIEGRYGFAVPAGTYTIVANKTNFEFPSKKLAGKTEDELYRDLYFGGPITVTEEGGIIAKNIPLDALNFDWNEYAKGEQHRLRHFHRQDVLIARISNVFFVFGFIVTGVSVLVSPTVFNVSLMSLYILIAVARIIGLQSHPKGSVKDFVTGTALPFSIVRVYSNTTHQEVLKRVADQMGKFYALVANGDYRVTVDRKNPDATYTSNYIPDPVPVRHGYLKEEFRI